MSALFDPGLQPERTALAWRRTALSLVVGGAAGMRVLPWALGHAGLVVGLATLAAGAVLGLVAHRRALRVDDALLRGSGHLPDGRLLLVLACLIAAVAAVAIVGVLLGGAR